MFAEKHRLTQWGPALAGAPTFGHQETGGTDDSILNIGKALRITQDSSITCGQDRWGTG